MTSLVSACRVRYLLRMTARALAHETGDYEQDVAAKLRGYLAEKRITKHQLAERLGQTDFWVGRRTNGQTPITVGELLTIADTLGEPLERFLPPRPGSSRSVYDYGSEGWGFESLRARPRRRERRRHLGAIPLYLIHGEATG